MLAGMLSQATIVAAKFFEISFGQLFKIEKRIMRMGRGADKLIELDLYGTRVAVLTVLNDEDHQEGDDGCASVDG